jgi:calcineurin-like phosphoesterase family protein
MRRLAISLLSIGAVGCSAIPHLRGSSYGAEAEPFLSPHAVAAIDREDDPSYRLILIGDGGAPRPQDRTLALLGVWADARPRHTTVLFLGDNVYPAGLRETDRAHGEAILRQQIEATRSPKLFIPGNHDWGFSARSVGVAGTLRNEERFVEAHAAEGADFEPKDGCPGPVAQTLSPPGKELAGGLTVLVVDFYWWLLPEALRPHCAGIDDTAAFVDRLDHELAAHAGENVIVAAHHPLRSGGPHGGLTRGFWIDVGANLYYRLHGPLQDLWEPTYAQMIRVVSAALTKHPPVAFVAGHDHSLQVLDGRDVARLLIVSGAGSAPMITGVTSIDGTLFAHSHPGFVVLDFFATAGRPDTLLVRVAEVGRTRPVFTLGLDLPPAEPAGSPPPAGPGRS